MILDRKVVVLQELEPSPLPKVQFPLGEEILQALVISENLTVCPIKIVPLQLKGKHYYRELEIMSRVVPFIVLQLA